MANTKELRAERARLVQQARDIQAAAEAEARAMSDEEVQNFDRAMEDADKLYATIEREERLAAAEATLAESRGNRTVESEAEERERGAERRVPGRITDEERGDALRGWLMRGTNDLPGESLVKAAQRCGVQLDNRLMSFDLSSRALRSLEPEDIREWQKRSAEQRAQSVGTDSEGGYTVPDDVMRALEVSMLRWGGMRQVADIIRTASGAALPWPTSNDTSNKGAILAENAQVSQQDITFGQLVLNAYKYSSKMILVPVELLQDSAINIAEHIGEALGIRIGRITNDHFTTGTGSSQPNGIVTAASLGKTGATGQTTTVIYDDLVDLEHSIDPDYRQNGRWMFADSTLKALKKIKVPNFSGQTDGTPLWQPGLAVNAPDTILGYPYVINQSMADMAASAKSIVFGDLSKYKIRDVQNVVLRRLDERFADFHQVAFLAFSRHDGDLLDAGTDPVKYYQNAAS